MKWLQCVLLLVCSFFIAVSITTSADAVMIIITPYGNWGVKSDCDATSISATTSAISASEGLKPVLSIGYDGGKLFIHVYWYGNLNLSKKSQFKYTLADNEFAGDDWVCQKNNCSPKDGPSAVKILKQLLANEGLLVIAITDNNKLIQATFDTTGLNEAHQHL